MRKLILISVLSLLGAVISCRTVSAPLAGREPQEAQSKVSEQAWNEILTFEGRKLTELNDTESGKLFKALRNLSIKPEKHLRHMPRLLIALRNSHGQKRYILVRTRGLFTPGNSAAKMYVFSNRGELLNEQHFSTGWRIAIKHVSKFVEQATGTEMILVETDPDWGGGEDIYKQYYGLVGDKITLVRMEATEGTLARNWYDMPHWTIGPELPWSSSSQLVDKVIAGKWAERLAVLTWLSSHHEDPSDEELDVEVKKDAMLVKEVLQNQKVLRHITHLSKAKDKWISQAAILVLESLKEDE